MIPPVAPVDLDEVLDALAQGLLWLDATGAVRRHNSAFRSLFKVESSDAWIGRPFAELMRALDDRDGALDHPVGEQILLVTSGESHTVEYVRRNGTILNVSATPLPSGGWVCAFLDVTREKRAQEEVKRSVRATVVAMANLAEYRDADTGAHVLRVARLVMQTAQELRRRGKFLETIDDTYIEHVGTASILHDVGKMATPDYVLFKNGPLSNEERQIINLHPGAGAKLIRQAHFVMGDSPYLEIGAGIALAHHERYDGRGYPAGLAGNDIPLAGRICAIADVFDALTSRRPYKAPWSTAKAMDLIRSQSGTQFDPAVVDAFVAVIEARDAVSLVQWSESMSVGNTHIDEQHQILIDVINHLASAESQNDRPLASMIIDELMNYAAYHFYFEEQIMESAGFPGLIPHREAHKDFVKWVTDAREDLLAHRSNQLGQRILHFLSEWLRKHILDEDQRYRSSISNL